MSSMPAAVEPWLYTASEVGATDQQAGPDTLLALPHPPASTVRIGQADQIWPSFGHNLSNLPVAITEAGGPAAFPTDLPPTPPLTSDSGSTYSQETIYPSSFQEDDALRLPTLSQRVIPSIKSHSKRHPKHAEPRRKMHSRQVFKKNISRPDPATSTRSCEACSFNSNANSKARPKQHGRKAEQAPHTLPPTPPRQTRRDGAQDFDEDDNNENHNFNHTDNDGLRDPRRRKILECNRIAAKKCRIRKRDEAAALAVREQALEDTNRYLATYYTSLSTQVYFLKTELLRHTHCNCTLIQKYISNEARRSVDKLNTSSSATHPRSHSSLMGLDSQTRRTTHSDTEATAVDNYNPSENPIGEFCPDRWANKLPDSAAIVPNVAYNGLYSYTSTDMSNYPCNNMDGELHDQPDGHIVGINRQEQESGQCWNI